MLGVVLCGGKSSRMGTDKGLLKTGNETWSQRAFEKLTALSLPCVVSIHPLQKNSYSFLFEKQQLVVDNVDTAVGGPLLGLLSVHALYAQQDLFVLACDLPAMAGNVLRALHNEYHQLPDFEAYAFRDEKGIEPLCAIYTSHGLAKILNLVNGNKFQKYSMIHVLDLLNTRYLSINEDWRSAFDNINTNDLLIDYSSIQ